MYVHNAIYIFPFLPHFLILVVGWLVGSLNSQFDCTVGIRQGMNVFIHTFLGRFDLEFIAVEKGKIGIVAKLKSEVEEM